MRAQRLVPAPDQPLAFDLIQVDHEARTDRHGTQPPFLLRADAGEGVFTSQRRMQGRQVDLPRQHFLALAGDQEIQKAGAEVRRPGAARDQADPRHHHGVILWQNDADIRIAGRPGFGIGAQDVVAEQKTPVGDPLQDRGGVGIELHAREAHGAHQLPDFPVVFLIARQEEEPESRAFDVIGADPPREFVFRLIEIVSQCRPGTRRLRGCERRLVIDDHRRFEGDTEG